MENKVTQKCVCEADTTHGQHEWSTRMGFRRWCPGNRAFAIEANGQVFETAEDLLHFMEEDIGDVANPADLENVKDLMRRAFAEGVKRGKCEMRKV